MAIALKEYRCKGCRKLLFKGILVESEVEVKCRNCGLVNTVAASKFDDYFCAIYPCPNRVVIAKKPKGQAAAK